MFFQERCHVSANYSLLHVEERQAGRAVPSAEISAMQHWGCSLSSVTNTRARDNADIEMDLFLSHAAPGAVLNLFSGLSYIKLELIRNASSSSHAVG
jgi:hypothetical protein